MHFDDFAGVMHAQAVAEFAGLPKQWLQDIVAPNQNGGAIGVSTKKFERGGNGDRRTVVTPHAIDGNRDRHRENGRALTHPAAFDSMDYSPLALTTFLPR